MSQVMRTKYFGATRRGEGEEGSEMKRTKVDWGRRSLLLKKARQVGGQRSLCDLKLGRSENVSLMHGLSLPHWGPLSSAGCKASPLHLLGYNLQCLHVECNSDGFGNI